MADPLDNTISLFNELMVSVNLYLLIALTDFNYINPDREILGWGLLCTVFLTVTVNLVKAIYMGCLITGKLLRKRRFE
jgi:MFS superfamily sulfate permease-like transporter